MRHISASPPGAKNGGYRPPASLILNKSQSLPTCTPTSLPPIMASETSSLDDRPYQTPDQEWDPEDPFRVLQLSDRDLPSPRNGPLNTECWYRPWDGTSEKLIPGSIDWLHRCGGDDGIIVIREVNEKTISMLIQAFPHLDLHFLHQHAARLDIPQSFELAPLHEIRIRQLSPQTEDSETPSGIHFDGYCSTSTMHAEANAPISFVPKGQVWAGQKYRTELFVRCRSAWYRASTRISCCMLRPELCE